MTTLLLGAHMSIAGGPANALIAGHSIGCTAIQMFTRNANRWTGKDLTPAEIAAFAEARQATGIDAIVAHSSYLINLGSPDDELWAKSEAALVSEMQRCEQLGIRDYVLHPGAHMGAGEETGLARIAKGLTQALSATKTVRILLETTAGQGSALGCRFEHLAWLLQHALPTERLGVCFDTAHALASGYEFRDAVSFKAMWAEFDRIIGLGNLGAMHINDSMKDLGSHVDRHEQIGKGFVGIEAFRLIVNDPVLQRRPLLLETPKSEDLHEDVENLAILRGLLA